MDSNIAAQSTTATGLLTRKEYADTEGTDYTYTTTNNPPSAPQTPRRVLDLKTPGHTTRQVFLCRIFPYSPCLACLASSGNPGGG